MFRASGRLGALALAAAGCGSTPGPADLHGALAFPAVSVEASTDPLTVEISGNCGVTDGYWQRPNTVTVYLQWNLDGGPVAGTWPLIDPSAGSTSDSASLYYRDLPDGPDDPRAGDWQGVGGTVTLIEAGPDYAGSFTTTVNEQRLSGSFSTAGPNNDQCACTTLPGGGMSCPAF
jgi:hypothetical protein